MKAYFDKLNLRPHERRLVVIVGLIFFLVINFWFVLPQFSEWNQVSARMDLERKNLAKFQTEIAKRPQYETRLAELQGGGSEFLTNDLQFLRLVQGQYNIAKLQVSQTRVRPAASAGSSPTQFYQELALDMSYTSGGNELVDFLVGLAAQNYMVRVREMNVRPDPSQTRLMGSLVLVGNLQTNVAGPALPKPASPPKTNAASASTTKLGTNRPALTPLSNKATNRPPVAFPNTKADTKKQPGPTTATKVATNNPGSRPPAVRPSPPAIKTAPLTNRTDI